MPSDEILRDAETDVSLLVAGNALGWVSFLLPSSFSSLLSLLPFFIFLSFRHLIGEALGFIPAGMLGLKHARHARPIKCCFQFNFLFDFCFFHRHFLLTTKLSSFPLRAVKVVMLQCRSACIFFFFVVSLRLPLFHPLVCFLLIPSFHLSIRPHLAFTWIEGTLVVAVVAVVDMVTISYSGRQAGGRALAMRCT